MTPKAGEFVVVKGMRTHNVMMARGVGRVVSCADGVARVVMGRVGDWGSNYGGRPRKVPVKYIDRPATARERILGMPL